MTVLAVARNDVAAYVNALFLIYIILVIGNVLLSWLPRMPGNRVLQAIIAFVRETTDPYLNLFRRLLPPLGSGGFAIDLSPIIGLFVLFILQAVFVGLIEG